jgi:hypothetical protein
MIFLPHEVESSDANVDVFRGNVSPLYAVANDQFGSFPRKLNEICIGLPLVWRATDAADGSNAGKSHAEALAEPPADAAEVAG